MELYFLVRNKEDLSQVIVSQREKSTFQLAQITKKLWNYFKKRIIPKNINIYDPLKKFLYFSPLILTTFDVWQFSPFGCIVALVSFPFSPDTAFAILRTYKGIYCYIINVWLIVLYFYAHIYNAFSRCVFALTILKLIRAHYDTRLAWKRRRCAPYTGIKKKDYL